MLGRQSYTTDWLRNQRCSAGARNLGLVFLDQDVGILARISGRACPLLKEPTGRFLRLSFQDGGICLLYTSPSPRDRG
eukprot:886441-Rhodomonas_salina.3